MLVSFTILDVEIHFSKEWLDDMAKIFGVELRNVSIARGMEDFHVEAEIFLDGKQVGYFIDEGSGGPGMLKFNCDLTTKKEFYYVAWRYFASYPEIDSLALYEYTQKEFSELKGSLPKVSYKEWPDEKVAMFFVNRIIYLYQLEEQFNQARGEGYSAIVTVRFFALKNAKAEPEKVFYTDGSGDMLNQVIAIIEKTNHNYVVTQYCSENDFLIGGTV